MAALSAHAARRLREAFAAHPSAGLLHLATAELESVLPPPLRFARDIARTYLVRLCHTPGVDGSAQVEPVPPPAEEELDLVALEAPPMKGLEYLNAAVLAQWWTDLDRHVREEIRGFPGGAQAYLREKNPIWRLVGRVTLHLAEHKRDDARPFAFMATYASRLSAQGRVQHLPLARALGEYAGAKNRTALVALLSPIQRATERSALAKSLVESGEIYQALAWTPREAYRFLQDIPALEESGLIVRVPDWWKAARPPRPQVSVRVGDHAQTKLGAAALIDFSVDVTLGGQGLSDEEMQAILASSGGLVRLRGQWVEVDREKLTAALGHWKRVERQAKEGTISFFEGMRLLAGVGLLGDSAAAAPEPVREWTGIVPGKWLDVTLRELRDPEKIAVHPPDLRTELRPYQAVGVSWLRFMTRLRLGACLADDMGLGKTIQVLALLLDLRAGRRSSTEPAPPSLLVVPASLIANWKSEIARFAPSLSLWVAHPSESEVDPRDEDALDSALAGRDLIITTYGMLARLETLRRRSWNLVVLDEAQAIKNSGARQTRAVKELNASSRIVLTGTPVENRLSDLWSLFDFLNPGLLGGAAAFSRFAKGLAGREHNPYGPLRALVRPYILRRLKTDKRVIADLPEKTEVKAFCGLTKRQAALYQQSVRELSEQIERVEGIERRGIVLAHLTRLKQICNHPSQWLGDGGYDPEASGKFQRLAALCEELAERQEKALVFTQFREITAPLAEHLQGVFGRPGLVLHGGTAVGERRKLVEAFQRDDGPPFFVLSLKAGGTGLNLTAACQVIHFDRWWNPAVENQATDRAFRIGQKRNVLVHKFVCSGTVEEKIDALIAEKVELSRDLLEGGGEKLITEMDNGELLRFVSLDIQKAVEE
jgi:non-specific serine/threonine protein kinase